MSGFIKLHRGWRDNPVFRGEFSRGEAWLWLLENACWKATSFDIKGKTVELQRGQLCASVRYMADAWGWSKSAVDRFLTRLETEAMVAREPGHSRAVITICNYTKYQDRDEANRDSSGTATGTAAGQQRDTKEEGQEQEEEKNTRFAFFGRTIRLNANDRDRWQHRYHAIADLEAELGSLDDWLQGTDDKTRGNWFHVVSGSLNKKHQAALREATSGEAPLRKGGIGI